VRESEIGGSVAESEWVSKRGNKIKEEGQKKERERERERDRGTERVKHKK